MKRVQIYLGSGQMDSNKPDGKGRQYRVQSGRRALESGGRQAYQRKPYGITRSDREIERKERAAEGDDVRCRSLKTDPKHYSLEFENDQVRVLRVRFGPHEKGVRHEHKLKPTSWFI